MQLASAGNVSMLVSAPSPPVIMTPAKGGVYEEKKQFIEV